MNLDNMVEGVSPQGIYAATKIQSVAVTVTPTRDKGRPVMKPKRFDQLEKKYHSKLKFKLYYRIQKQLRAGQTNKRVKKDVCMRQMAKEVGMDQKSDVFVCFLGSGTKYGLLKPVLREVLSNPHIIQKLLPAKNMDKVLKSLHKQTRRDIEVNFMSKVRNFLNPASDYYHKKDYLDKHINGIKACKKPFTRQENLLAAYYFYARLKKEVGKDQLDALVVIRDCLDYIQLKK